MNKQNKKVVLGISGLYHDSAAALVVDGVIVSAAHEERFTRKKHDAAFPVEAIKYCLQEANLTHGDVTQVVFYEKPLIKFERIIETFLKVAPKGIKTFLTGIPPWLSGKIFATSSFTKDLKKAGFENLTNLEMLYVDHHLSHAASAFFPSPFSEAVIITIDGVGEKTTASISIGKENKISSLKEMIFPDSVGLLYSAFTHYLGFRVNSGEYKLMGLAPYGIHNSPQVENFKKLIKGEMLEIFPDGSIKLNMKYFSYESKLEMTNNEEWEKLLGVKIKTEKDELLQIHCDLGLAIQEVTEEIVVKMVEYAVKESGMKNICMAGGVALNCVANSKILEQIPNINLWIQPASGDAGGALGAALAVNYMYLDGERKPNMVDSMKGSYLGPEYSDYDVETVIRKYKAVASKLEENILLEKVAKEISLGAVVGWMQGRMEWGPRALGNRSFLADARDETVQKKLNLKVKFREGFRPFAPIVLASDVSEYFEVDKLTDKVSPYMLFVAKVKESLRTKLPADFNTWKLYDRLYFKRSTLPAITHLDFSARLQTVHKETNLKLHSLLSEFKKQTGCAVLVNTSFNVRGEPIVCNPDDAYRCFMRSDTEFLVIGNYLFDKKLQPKFIDTEIFAAD